MRISIFTFGTKGDVLPYISLALEAMKRGHTVTICTGEYFREDIEKNNISFACAKLDLMEVLRTDIGQIIYNAPYKQPVKVFKYIKNTLNPLFRESFTSMLNSAKTADVILYHPKALASQDIALFLNIPCISIPLVPIGVEIEEFPNPFISTKYNFGKNLNRLSYKLTSKVENNNIKQINDFRIKELNFDKRKPNIYNEYINSYKIPIIFPIGEELFSDSTSLLNKSNVVNHFFYDKEEKLDDDLLKFINSGKKPVIISFSSLPIKDKKYFSNIIEQSIETNNERLIILTGENELKFKSNNIYVKKYAPHNILLKYSKGFIHHGGAGSTGIALKNNVPQFIIPSKLDQPFWASITYKKNKAIKPVKIDKLTKEVLEYAYTQFDKFDNNEKISLENGTIKAMDIIENTVQSFKGY